MHPDHTKRLTFFLLALPIAAIFMIMLFGDKADPVADWLDRWQTLIAGAFAVAAALFTVGQMQKSDTLQEARHRQLVRLTLRADILSADRAAERVEILEMAWSAIPDVPEFAGTVVDQLGAENEDVCDRVDRWLGLIEEEVTHRFITAAEPLFDPMTASFMDTVLLNISDTQDAVARLRMTASLAQDEEAVAARKQVRWTIREVDDTLGYFIESLRALPRHVG
ncbi:hypothetical protein [Mesorhizobium sp.]|uniref:hypothetical protein n=1 Tax=Mesorhizobium sp. TaxID=1871066 RepID=UPI000FE99B33|nr:hypothetical protein [Mesorhizobium sp.]RWC58899.1 MAG: hypothetical protein EOS56_18490 [Mesorhizobium sp.]RWC66511.1 MAG: hypothetical protein EOS29_03845 [Mesorhizobium sp.]